MFLNISQTLFTPGSEWCFFPLSEPPGGKEACAQIACAPITVGAFSVPCINWNVEYICDIQDMDTTYEYECK